MRAWLCKLPTNLSVSMNLNLNQPEPKKIDPRSFLALPSPCSYHVLTGFKKLYSESVNADGHGIEWNWRMGHRFYPFCTFASSSIFLGGSSAQVNLRTARPVSSRPWQLYARLSLVILVKTDIAGSERRATREVLSTKKNMTVILDSYWRLDCRHRNRKPQ